MLKTLLVACVFACAVFTACDAYPTQPANPIIAIVTTPLIDCLGWATPPSYIKDYSGGCLESYYVRWLEAAGIRAVPLIWNATWATKKSILDSVNGVLFPGGGLGAEAFTEYVNNATLIYNYAIDKNHNGDPFFLWGTCQGFQVLGVMAAGTQEVLKCIYHGVDPLMLSLNFTSYQPQSVMFGARATSPENIVNILKTENSTLNWHHCGISPQAYQKYNATFGKIFTVISTNNDMNGLSFISSYEGAANGLNFFSTQFHPERILFEFSNDLIGHTPNDVRVSTYLSMFISSRLRMNNHSYPTAIQADAATIENYPSVNLGWGSVVYWIHS